MNKRATKQRSENNLGKLRKDRRLSQYDLEIATGISQARLSLLERGYRELTASDVEALCGALGVRPSELFGIMPK